MGNGFITKAIKEGESLLELCKSDNPGVRYDFKDGGTRTAS